MLDRYKLSLLILAFGFFSVTEGDVVIYKLRKFIFKDISIGHELVLEELFGRWSFVRVLGETLGDEVLERVRPSTADRRWALLDDIQNYPMLGLIDIGRVTVCHLHCEDAQTPDVDTSLISSFSFNKLWRHPAHCADFTRASISLLSELSGVAKVSKFDLAISVDKDVVRFDISMNDMLLMQVVESKQSLTEHISATVFRVLCVHTSNEWGQSIIHDLYEDP